MTFSCGDSTSMEIECRRICLILLSMRHGSGDLFFQMACPQGRDMVTEVGGPPRDVGRPLHEVAHPPGGAEGVTTPELSGRLYQLSIGLFY